MTLSLEASGSGRWLLYINSTGEGFDLDMTLRPPQEEPLTGHVHLGRWKLDPHSLLGQQGPGTYSRRVMKGAPAGSRGFSFFKLNWSTREENQLFPHLTLLLPASAHTVQHTTSDHVCMSVMALALWF